MRGLFVVMGERVWLWRISLSCNITLGVGHFLNTVTFEPNQIRVCDVLERAHSDGILRKWEFNGLAPNATYLSLFCFAFSADQFVLWMLVWAVILKIQIVFTTSTT